MSEPFDPGYHFLSGQWWAFMLSTWFVYFLVWPVMTGKGPYYFLAARAMDIGTMIEKGWIR